MTMTTSAAGVAAIRQREGCRLKAYDDGVGVLTIGVGHTGRAGPPAVTAGMTITQAEADEILAADLKPFEAAVSEATTVILGQNQFDACVSLAFNIGAPAFRTSSVVRKINAGDLSGAADAFLLWSKAGGKVFAGLATRRQAERAQFLGTSVHAVPAPPSRAVVAGKAASAAVVVAGSSAAAAAPHGHWLGWLGMGIAILAAGIFAAIHWRKK